jgi:acyl carrier protein
MNRIEIKKAIIEVIQEKYQVDISGIDENGPLSSLKDYHGSLDSLGVVELLFDFEDKLGVELKDENFTPTTLKQVIDEFEKIL